MALTGDYNYASYALPTPTDTPYRTPSRGLSRRSSRNGSSSPAPSSSPPLPADYYSYNGHDKDVSKDENISILDPRRFTPTLHASLVSEILSLRREVESKNKLVLSLEESLHSSKEENETLNEKISSNLKESRTMKHQMEMLEGGTLSALEDLAKERDTIAGNLTDARRRLEVAQKKMKLLEVDIERERSIWDRDREGWEGERRMLDRKVHTAESRLKTVLLELAATHANNQTLTSRAGDRTSDSDYDLSEKDSQPHRSESSMSNYTQDGNENRNVRRSLLSGLNGFDGSKVTGLSLAEELNFDEEVGPYPGADNDVDYASEIRAGSPTRQRPFSRQSYLQSSKARRIMGLPIGEDEETETRAWQDGEEKVEDEMTDPISKIYTDTATQFSRPTSPGLSEEQTVSGVSADSKQELMALENAGKLDPNSADLDKDDSSSITEPKSVMVSQACQTDGETVAPEKPAPMPLPEMKTTSTQTIEIETPVDTREDYSPSMGIPIIAIHPPTSSSLETASVTLPPHTKNATCQASIEPYISLRSVSVQTEEIRIDQRAIKLPAHLLPSAISSQPPSPSPSPTPEADPAEKPAEPATQTQPILESAPPSRPAPQPRFSEEKIRQVQPTKRAFLEYPENDTGPLKHTINTDIKRPLRFSSLFAGFDDADDGLAETDESDDDFLKAEPVRKTLSKVQNSWKLVPQTSDSITDRLGSKHLDPSTAGDAQDAAPKKHAKWEKPEKTSSTTAKPDNIRKKALIYNGVAVHAQRARSPSAPTLHSPTASTVTSTATSGLSNAIAPPFPVPTRSSSRKIPMSSSDGACSPTPQPAGLSGGTRGREHGKRPMQRPTLRKVRSDVVPPKFPKARAHSRDRSPPPMSPTSSIPESPQLPPLPNDTIAGYSKDFQSPRSSGFQSPRDTQAPPTPSQDNGVQQTGVVDAIAQTMVGEWMWKYVRRRKSFGIPESPQTEFDAGQKGGDNGTRHKRWVWLAPYERAVMWSTKQPQSGSALMGKSGRKLAIQSVLDVKDDTPMPKGSPSTAVFGRSILILTPQRALKFTAMSRERHYVWLTALSFLSHSSLGVDDLASIPPIPSQGYRPPPPPPTRPYSTLRRNPIRDSIRVAKGKARPSIANVLAGPLYSNGPASAPLHSHNHMFSSEFQHDSEPAAEAPHIPRTSAHTRKRSNTGPRPVPVIPTSYRNFSGANIPSREGPKTANPTGWSNTGIPSAGMNVSSLRGEELSLANVHESLSRRRTEDAIATGGFSTGMVSPALRSGFSTVASGNFFDALGSRNGSVAASSASGMGSGTVRMEAFVDHERHGLPQVSSMSRGGGGMMSPPLRSAPLPPLQPPPTSIFGVHGNANTGSQAPSGYSSEAAAGSKKQRGSYRTRQGWKKESSYWGAKEKQQEQSVRGGDPFEGF